tara:strand:- start:86 stop:2959 length:2874 start_codon:yes stop_codon:yes gene_type:complete
VEIISTEIISIENISIMDNDLVWYDNTEDNHKMFILKEKKENAKYEYYSDNDNSDIDNLVNLTYVNIPSIMNVLNKRYNNNSIYTFNGNILISINPFKNIDIYNHDNVNLDEPHVFSLAEIAYKNVQKKNQSILVSGESGSGKTENTKYILKYLCKKYANNNILSDKIIYSNYIIELFGNAKTIRNDNSSRFGKFIKLYIKDDKIIGGDIENYLLEKLRVSFVNNLEKTYHIFYLVSTNQIIRDKYGFKSPENYSILKNSKYTYEIKEFLDYELFIETLQNFQFSDKEIDTLFLKLKLILELLDIETKTDLICILDKNIDVLENIDIKKVELFNILTKRVFFVSGEKIEKDLDDKEIRVQIKSYSEDLYEDLFNFVIDKINNHLGEKTDKYISILDIFGFEIFDHNSYEQLCINYTNEVLQQIYNQYIFQNEQIEYEKEDIDWTKIDFKRNDNIIDLFTDKVSLFSIINEQSILGSGTDIKIFNSISKFLVGDLLQIEKSKRRDNIFQIRHYTGNVDYTIDNYIEKNRIKSKSSKIKTNLQYFTNQLTLLKKRLDENQCYFIRCIKPNDQNSPNLFNQKKVYIQLLYSGIIEGIKIVLSGYPVKKYKDDLIQEFRYFNYCNKVNIIDYLKTNIDDKKKYQIGINKVFLKKDVYEEYLKTNNRYKNTIVTDLQKHIKRHLQRKQYIDILVNLVIIQNNTRHYLAKKILNNLKICNANNTIASYIYTLVLRKKHIYKYNSVYLLKIYINNKFLQIEYKNKKNVWLSSKKIALWYRRYLINRKIKERKSVKKLSNIVTEKETIIKDKNDIILKQNQQIEKLINMLKNDKNIDNKTFDIDNVIQKDIIDQDDKNTELNDIDEYCIVNDTQESINNPKIKKSVIKENYFKESSYILSNSDSDTLKENKLEDIGTKMHNLYLELNSKDDDINMINHKYEVLLLAYERERKRNSTFSFIKNLFN